MKHFILILFFPFSMLAQHTIEIETYNKVNPLYLKLLNDDDTIREDDVLNEQLLDLVKPYTIDSTYKRKTERHQMFGAAIFRWFGIRWKTIRYTREKYVGTVSRVSISSKELFTEYDVNFDVVPHLKTYIDLSYEAHMAQYKMSKSRKTRKRVGEGNPPFVYPDENTNLKPYKIHCEVTPLRAARVSLNEKFYPTVNANSIETHINFGQKQPSLGLYGPYILDCNHTCHPEIHPYEWIWWLDLNPNKTKAKKERIWWVGFLRDASKRFVHWSTTPRVGEISIPFIIKATADTAEINMAHQVFTGFDKEAFNKLSLPAGLSNFNFTEKVFTLKGEGLNIPIKFTTNHPITAEGIAFYFDELNYDKETGYISGKLNLAMAVNDVYTTRVAFK